MTGWSWVQLTREERPIKGTYGGRPSAVCTSGRKFAPDMPRLEYRSRFLRVPFSRPGRTQMSCHFPDPLHRAQRAKLAVPFRLQ